MITSDDDLGSKLGKLNNNPFKRILMRAMLSKFTKANAIQFKRGGLLVGPGSAFVILFNSKYIYIYIYMKYKLHCRSLCGL